MSDEGGGPTVRGGGRSDGDGGDAAGERSGRSVRDRARHWLLGGLGLCLGGLLGGLALAGLSLVVLGRDLEWPLLAGSAALAAPLGVGPLRYALGRCGRTGPAWGAIAGAYGAVLLVAMLGAFSVAVSDIAPGRAVGDAALLLVLATPYTAALAGAGALLESARWPP